MNIVFWALVIILAVFLWLALSSCFKGIGEFLSDLWGDAKDAMNETENEDEEDEEQ